MIIDTLQTIQASRKFASAADDGNLQKGSYRCTVLQGQINKAPKSLVYSKGVALTELTNRLCI